MNGQIPTNSGTACLVHYKDQDYIVTNWHVVTGIDMHETQKPYASWTEIDIPIVRNGENTLLNIFKNQCDWFEYKKDNIVQADVAIMSLHGLIDIENQKYNIDDLDSSLNISDHCWIVGYPRDYVEQFVSENKQIGQPREFKTSVRQAPLNSFRPDLVEFVDHQTGMGSGMSGSPVFDSKDCLQGIYSGLASQFRNRKLYDSAGAIWTLKSVKLILDSGTIMHF